METAETLPCQGCSGLCCGPVPITNQELKSIKKHLKSIPIKSRIGLENQDRHLGTCIFYDQDKDRCGIHTVRPAICRAFGFHKNLICFRKTEAATRGIWHPKENQAGILSQDYTWKDFK